MNLTDDASMDEQVEDLRDRMKLLHGDRKANVEILEANKNANKEAIRDLRSENKDLRKALAVIQQENSMNVNSNNTMDEIEEMRLEVGRMRRSYDDQRADSKKYSKELEELKDVVKDLELEARRPNLEDSPLTRKIRMLENRLDKAMIKYNEAQSIRKTYEQIVKRLKEERVGFDNQLVAIERTLAAKNHDYEELLLLSGDANHAREVANAELERVRGGYDEERRQRERELRERQQLVQIKADMQNRMEKREKQRQEIIQREAGELGDDEERALKKSLKNSGSPSTGGAGGKQSEDRKEHRSKIDIFENAFRKIKEATGVSDVNEVIQKIVSQEGTTDNLMMLTRENQTKIETLNEERNSLKGHVEEMKYSGPGGGHRRKMVDDHEENLTASLAKLERARLKYERLAKMLINVKAGIDHLNDKLSNVRTETHTIQMTDDTIVDVMYQCEQTLVHLLQQTRGSEGPGAAAAAAAAAGRRPGSSGAGEPPRSPVGSAVGVGVGELEDEELAQSRMYNQRIYLPDAEEGEKMDDDDGGVVEDDPVGLGEVDEDELTRDKVKKASSQIMLQQDKKKKKPKKKRGGGDFEEGLDTGGRVTPKGSKNSRGGSSPKGRRAKR